MHAEYLTLCRKCNCQIMNKIADWDDLNRVHAWNLLKKMSIRKWIKSMLIDANIAKYTNEYYIRQIVNSIESRSSDDRINNKE